MSSPAFPPRPRSTLIAELLPGWQQGDPALGHPFEQADWFGTERYPGAVILADEQPLGVPLFPGHACEDADRPDEQQLGNLVHLERSASGAVWGVFSIKHLGAVDYLEGYDKASIRYRSAGRRKMPDGYVSVCAFIESVSLTDRPAACTRQVRIATFGDVADAPVGRPNHFDDWHAGLLTRAHATCRRIGPTVTVPWANLTDVTLARADPARLARADNRHALDRPATPHSNDDGGLVDVAPIPRRRINIGHVTGLRG